MFQISSSGMNLVSRGNKVCKSRKDFLSERVINYWNNLPPYVKVSTSVDMFKCNLEAYKLSSMGEYSCRCHGKRVISAPSEPLKLKLAGHIL